MKSLIKIVLVLSLFTGFYSCQNEDSTSATPDRPYEEVYLEDIAEIEDFLHTHYVTVDSDFNTTFTQIPDGGSQTPIWDMPELDTIQRKRHDITYTIYYLNLREGSGENITRVDSSFVSYKGFSFAKTTVDAVDTYTQTVFDSKQNPVWLSLDEVIRGWAEVIPKFKTGTFSSEVDGTISFDNFGTGVMFLPSGLAYFSSGTLTIPSYAPLVFSFKLHNLRRRDHDRDGILSMHEYGPNFVDDAIDTDGDERPDYIDVDDDADGVLTKTERSFTYLDGTETRTGYYPFNGALVDNPSTPYDDTKGIPSCSNDFITATRLRRHLDPTCRN
ncbi:MAG: FKBP-type peptidylprolyl isomerase [Flavobacterium sp.]|uniref:FKBP-type peptidyl-prolyl cis-trans isomerase n=1 Tax=Flavobacterium sp. TaxID=239 RepID=UPI002B467AAA|nr:FKBP-type peptidylprolyl isomerase [Flavobacterium sp.]WRH73848.1 MAG: FKBP-type peptidylprolyl isomerase [Flavobacterium sp.]